MPPHATSTRASCATFEDQGIASMSWGYPCLGIHGCKYDHTRRVCLRTPSAPTKASERCWSSFLHRTTEASLVFAFDDLDSPWLSLQALCHLHTTSRGSTEGWGIAPHRCTNGIEMRPLARRQMVLPAGYWTVRAVEETALIVGCRRQAMRPESGPVIRGPWATWCGWAFVRVSVALWRHQRAACVVGCAERWHAWPLTASRAFVSCRGVATGGSRWMRRSRMQEGCGVNHVAASRMVSLLVGVRVRTTLERDLCVPVITHSPVQGHACALWHKPCLGM